MEFLVVFILNFTLPYFAVTKLLLRCGSMIRYSSIYPASIRSLPSLPLMIASVFLRAPLVSYEFPLNSNLAVLDWTNSTYGSSRAILSCRSSEETSEDFLILSTASNHLQTSIISRLVVYVPTLGYSDASLFHQFCVPQLS